MKEIELKQINTNYGRVSVSGGGEYLYEYFIKDHLGNVRVMFADLDKDGQADLI